MFEAAQHKTRKLNVYLFLLSYLGLTSAVGHNSIVL